MSGVDRTTDDLTGLLAELRNLPRETKWVEFKENNNNPEEIGEYISGLSNSAALCGKTHGYVIWGIADKTHEVVGTDFRPGTAKKGNEDLESWLLRLLSPRIDFHFWPIDVAEQLIVLLEIPRASSKPVQFQGNRFIRVGSYLKKLKDFPEKERELWRIFDRVPFEEIKAVERLPGKDVLALLDYPSYFDLLKLPLPDGAQKILERLSEERMVSINQAGGWDITNLGAVLFAKNMEQFKGLRRKIVRVVFYDDKGRLKTIREHVDRKGYATGFQGLIDFLNGALPQNEEIGKALRKEMSMFPEPAIRELVANALIHQDLSVTGSGPMIEVFSDRIEITNPGLPLVNTDRFLDSPPRSRNEVLASFMRRAGICEERGSGVDKVVFQTELFQLPAPSFETPEGSTRAVLSAYKALKDMDRTDRVRACYLHACLRFVHRDPMTNSSLRERFGILEHNAAIASRIIRDTMEEKRIKPYDPEQGKKYAKYVPFWA
ncbi:MAG: putative DNA binding domain-containing protein [Proteobacteria bacterium]|nr:putative DNA binding domain-containing protein [Pseudomonadota bacterium]